MSQDAFICDAIRTPIGSHGGTLSLVRADDLAAIPIRAVMTGRPNIDWCALDDVYLGCANQAVEDNRNVARMAGLLAGLPIEVPGATVNRLCGSGMEAVLAAARAIRAGEGSFYLAGGVESMSRAPYVVPKPITAFSRECEIADTTIGWRLVNPRMDQQYGVDPLGITAENVADQHHVTREDQDALALRSQTRAARAKAEGRFAAEIVPVEVKTKRGVVIASEDEHPRPNSSADGLARLRPAFRDGGTVTAGNSSGVNDGAAVMILASEKAARRFGLTPRARILGGASAGVAPRVMGIGPVPASRKLLERLGMKISDIDIVELNEAFAAQVLAVLRQLGLPDDAEHVNPNGGGIALGHPLGMSGARLLMTATTELERRGLRRALCTMCVGVAQGISTVIERV